MMNGKFICTEGFNNWFTEGEIYTFIDGRTKCDNKFNKLPRNYKSLEQFNSVCSAQLAPAPLTLTPQLTIPGIDDMQEFELSRAPKGLKYRIKNGTLEAYDKKRHRDGWRNSCLNTCDFSSSTITIINNEKRDKLTSIISDLELQLDKAKKEMEEL